MRPLHLLGWVAAKEFKLTYHNSKTILISSYVSEISPLTATYIYICIYIHICPWASKAMKDHMYQGLWAPRPYLFCTQMPRVYLLNSNPASPTEFSHRCSPEALRSPPAQPAGRELLAQGSVSECLDAHGT